VDSVGLIDGCHASLSGSGRMIEPSASHEPLSRSYYTQLRINHCRARITYTQLRIRLSLSRCRINKIMRRMARGASGERETRE